MTDLYHGSGYKQKELKPGIHYTGVKIDWDKTESNEWLYATTVMEEAIAQGFCSVVEKTYNVARFQSSGNKITFAFRGTVPELDDILELDVYLYTIRNLPEHNWIAVNNLHNGMVNEYKTKETISSIAIRNVIRVNLRRWVKGKEIELRHANASMNWK